MKPRRLQSDTIFSIEAFSFGSAIGRCSVGTPASSSQGDPDLSAIPRPRRDELETPLAWPSVCWSKEWRGVLEFLHVPAMPRPLASCGMQCGQRPDELRPRRRLFEGNPAIIRGALLLLPRREKAGIRAPA